MPYTVNGQLVPEEIIREEHSRIARDPRWMEITDERERARQHRAAAEQCAIDRVMIEQVAEADPRPIDASEIERELARIRKEWACRTEVDETAMRSFVERQLKLARTHRDLVASAAPPSEEVVASFYAANRLHFSAPDRFHAAHIVKYTNAGNDEQQAFLGILEAQAALNEGQPFGDVADRYSDCKDKGGDLGYFPAGYMVPEFEAEIRKLEVGQRSGIIRTPFGFHVAELRGKIPSGFATFEEVRAEIERVLTFASQHDAYAQTVSDLRACADIRFVSVNHATASS